MSYPHLFDGTGSRQSIFETSLIKKHTIGARGVLGDGRVFHYASMAAGTAIGPNKLAQACPPVALHVTQTGASTGTTVANTRDTYKAITVTLGATAAYADEYENGMMKIESASTGAGQSWSIPTHLAVLASGVLTFNTREPVVTATSGTTTWTLVHNPWGSVVIQPTTVTAPCVGVTLVNWPAASSTALNYGWLQTWGLCSILKDTSTVVAGHGVGISNATAGAIAVAAAADIEQRIGASFDAFATSGAYTTVFLQIAP